MDAEWTAKMWSLKNASTISSSRENYRVGWSARGPFQYFVSIVAFLGFLIVGFSTLIEAKPVEQQWRWGFVLALGFLTVLNAFRNWYRERHSSGVNATFDLASRQPRRPF